MSKQFDPLKVLRHASVPLLRRLFDKVAGGLHGVDWDALAAGRGDVAKPVFEAWQRLPEPARGNVLVALQDANELADDRGLPLVADELAWRCPDRVPEFAALESRVDKAIWALVTVPEAFDEATRYARADALAAGRYWYRRDGVPKAAAPFEVGPAVTKGLAEALAGYYGPAQARGHHCHVEHYRRPGGGEYFFAYLDDYPETLVDFDDAGAIRRRPLRSAFDNVFVYGPADGTLELVARGGRKVRTALEQLFCRAVLGAEVGPAEPDAAAFSLEGLKDPAFAFATDPADGVADVRLRRLRLEVVGRPGQRVALEVGPKGDRGELHQMIAAYLDAKALPMSAVRVTQATVQLTFVADGGGRPRTLTFDVSHPCSCDLKSRPDDVRAVGERCLKLWGVAA